VTLNRHFECQDVNCEGTFLMMLPRVVGDRDIQAAGAIRGIGENYERTLGGRYAWNLSVGNGQPGNQYDPPIWLPALQ
jgi:hypothetical protein